MPKYFLSLTQGALALVLVGCGGGQAVTDPPAQTGLSATQVNFELAAIADKYVNFYWFLPSSNVAPTNGLHYMYYNLWGSAGSPSSVPQLATKTTKNIGANLNLPTGVTQQIDCALKGNVIYTTNQDSKVVWSYSGAEVIASTYATDGITVVDTAAFDNWSAPIPLSGTIASATFLRSFFDFTKMTSSPAIFDFSNTWKNGSSYFTRKGYQKYDTVWVLDWPASTSSATCAVNPFPGTASTIEDMFASATVKAAGGVTLDAVLYPQSAGSIVTIEGTRAWVAQATRPHSVNATDTYAVIFELNGKLYMGSLWRAGSRFKTIDRIDATVLNDYGIRLNAVAASSIAQAAKF
jgi:hypothetical protein